MPHLSAKPETQERHSQPSQPLRLFTLSEYTAPFGSDFPQDHLQRPEIRETVPSALSSVTILEAVGEDKVVSRLPGTPTAIRKGYR